MTDTATIAGLDPATLGDLLRVAGSPGFDRWREQIRRTGGCANPIHLSGWTLTKDKTTGETLHRYSTDTEPDGRLRVACGNRRASRCPACAWMYAADTYSALIYQHSNLERQREVAGGIDARVRAERGKAADVPDEQPSGTERARDAWHGPDNNKAPGRWPGASVWSG